MADDNTETSGKRRRPATIDLKATEVASAPGKPSEPADMPKENPPAPPEAQTGSSPPEPESRDGPAEWLASMKARISALRESISRRLDWRVIAASAAGVAIVLAVFLAVLAAGVFDRRDDSLLASRLAQLELQVRELAGRPQPAPVDPRPLADLASRVAAAEQAVGKMDTNMDTKIETRIAAARPTDSDPALAGRVATLETALRPLLEQTARIEGASAAAREAKTRADAAYAAAQETAKGASAAPSRKEIDDLTARVAALEQATKSAEARITTTAGADKAGRLAFTAAVLRATVARGEPFGRELGAVRPLVADAKMLAPLEPFAATGVPGAAALSRELSQLSGAMLAAVGTPARGGGFIDRLQATGLIRIRPISEGPGEDPTTVIGRAEVKATHGDLAGARADIAALPPAVQAPAQSWIARVDARDAALAAARDLAESAIGTLAKP
jgi:hypothetical protein